ncbi:Helix-turn-helix [Legionella quinlivanii DSM 21216]|uniref:helix-turn-helix domain-containing protein n=1 Tax=Legionella quinlivanii TaxID=45073 RepID=UPI00089ECED5|nr:XRE family transcriptional regulator [Legionella quinlivanii]SEG42027.1 Helix-turn-helix [Legionella quinlivanii DSM 21216]
MDIKLKIGLRIKESRKSKNLSAVQLAERTGFSAQRISNWERGARTPKFKDAEILGNALGVSPTWLLFLEFDQPIKNNNFQTIPIINSNNDEDLLPIPLSVREKISVNDFSFIIQDKSMFPTYNVGDIVIFSHRAQNACDMVLINIKATGENLFRKMSYSDNAYTFSPINLDWPQIRFESQEMFQIIGWIKNGIKVFY